ncbi:MAG TPA: tellurite resistance/C4-dicarboxylate transporter family protein [Oleiagrimonas sp.]|nr:tellurite resistance/C4-dicarboxylate transporter family protein [Oleiagrimonas sp.]
MSPSPRQHTSPLANLSPAYFSMVMATGILSVGAWRLDFPQLAYALFGLNVAIYALLWVLYVWRLLRYPRQFIASLFDHVTGMGFFTMVAATGILGSQCLLLIDAMNVAVALLILAIALWLALTYSIFTAFTIKDDKPPLDKGINGAWLLAVVASQAIAALSAQLAAHSGHDYVRELNFLTLSMWLFGGMLYIWMMSLIFYRYTFFELRPSDLSPPYWINMGAMAISTLVGAQLGLNAASAPLLHSLLPFIKGFTVFYWATGTWWIPMLVVLGFWRHVYKRYPLRYEPLYWGSVFPVGMYATGTWEMSRMMDLPFLRPVTYVMFVAALVAWTALFVGQLRELWRHRHGALKA